MKARIASTLTLWLATVAALWLGRAWGGLAILILLGGAAQWEFYGMLERLGAAPRKVFGVIMGVALPVTVFLKGSGIIGADTPALVSGDGTAPVATLLHRMFAPGEPVRAAGALRPDLIVFTGIGLAIAAVFFVQLARHKSLLGVFKAMPTLAGVLGFPFMMTLYAWPAAIHWGNRGDLTGVYWVVWAIAVTKFTDVGALLTGRVFGKTKLWPAVSPGKTREGCIGGILTSCAVGAGLAFAFGKLGWGLDLSPAKAALAALPLAILSVPSDLVESVFKRLTGQKDSGRTIPGIGGAYDLVDSLLLTAPVSLALYLAVTA